MQKKIIHFILVISFIFQQAGLAQTVMPQAGAPALEHVFRPLQLRSVSFDPQTSSFALIADPGDIVGKAVADNTVDYFKTGLMFPNESFWVNLRPDGAEQMLDPALENTEVARILLEADVQLKKDLAAMTDPSTAAGRTYWQKVYERAESLFGREEAMEIPTVTRPWIVPGEIIIGESENQAFVYKAMLKVCVQEDYLSGSPAPVSADPRLKQLNEYSSGLIRSLIIPQLTRQVNSSKQYAMLRQVFYSLVLAQWVKERFPDRTFSFPQAKAGTITVPWSKMDYFKKYQESFARGEYNKDETICQGNDLVIRHYSSGGIEAFLHDNPGLIRVPTHVIQRAIEHVPGLVVLPAVQAQVVTKDAAFSRDGGMSVGQVEKVLEQTLGKAVVARVKDTNSNGYQMFLEIVQSLPGQDEQQFLKRVEDISSLVGTRVVSECLYSDPVGLGMLLQRLTDTGTKKFFIEFSGMVGAPAIRSALLGDTGSFVEGVIDRAARVGNERFLRTMEDVFGKDGMPVARGMVARSDGYFEELIDQASAPEKAALLEDLSRSFGKQAVLDALSTAPGDFVEALYAKDAGALEKTITRSRELMQRFHSRITGSSDSDFVQALADVRQETNVEVIAAGLADLFRLQDVLYPDTSGLVDLDQGRPVFLIPDVHSRRNELFIQLQKKDASGKTNLGKILSGELQLVILGDLVHSESRERWQAIEKGLDNRDDRVLQEEIADGLGTVEMVLMLKGRCPGSVHWLRGNHDSVMENVRKYTERGGGEGALVRSWLENSLGEDFVRLYSRLEKRLPLMARGKNFITSHSEPGIRLRQAQVSAKSDDAVYALSWSRDEGMHTRQLLREMLGTEEGLYIAGHTPQTAGMTVLSERNLMLLNSQRILQFLVIDGRQVVHNERGPVWQFAQEQTAADAAVYSAAASHGFVNEYIENNLPDYLYERDINDQAIKDIVSQVIQTHCPEVQGYGVKARVIPIQGLFANTRQFAHIGLGQVYGMPVIYCDQDYVSDQTVLGHELYEISKWEELRVSLKLQPGEMRQWIRKNIAAAQEKANAWHRQAPTLDDLFAAAGEQGGEEFADPYAAGEDVNLGAQLSLDDFYFQRHPLIDIARFEAEAISVYQEGQNIDYRDLAVSRLPINTKKAVARIYRYGYGYGRQLFIYTRKDIPLTDDLVIALAKIGEGFNIKKDNPKTSFQKAHQRRLADLLREDTGKAFGKNRVVVNGRYYYTEKGELKSRGVKDISVLQNQEAVRRLLAGEKIFGKSIIGVSSAVRDQAEAVRQEIIENRRLQKRKVAEQRDGGLLMDKELAVFSDIDAPLKSFVALEQRSLFLAQLSHFFDRDLEFNSTIRLRVRDLEENNQQVEINSVKNIVMRLMFNAYDSIATLYDDHYCQTQLPQESLQLLDRKTKRTINVRYTREMKFGKQALKVEVEDNGAGNRAADYAWKNRSQREGNRIYLGGLGIDNKIIFYGDERTGQQSLLQILWAAAGVDKGDFYEYNEDDRGAKVALWIPMESLKEGDDGFSVATILSSMRNEDMVDWNRVLDKVDLVVFDVDGVIVDTTDLWVKTWNRVFTKYGGPAVDLDFYKAHLNGASGLVFLRKYLPREVSDEEINRIYTETSGYYMDFLANTGIQRFDSSVTFIKMLRERGIQVVFGSGSNSAYDVLKMAGLGEYCGENGEFVVMTNDVERGKPDPQIFQLAAKRKGITDPSKILVVGDAMNDMLAARAAGYAGVGIDRGGDRQDLYEAGAAVVVTDLLVEGKGMVSRDGGIKAVSASIEDYLIGEFGRAGIPTFDFAAEGVAQEIAGTVAFSSAPRIIRLDMSSFKPGGLSGAINISDSYHLIRHSIWDLGEALRPVFHEPRGEESQDRPSFAVEELIKNAFVHGNDGNFDLPIYLVIDMHEGQFMQARVLDMAVYVNTGLAGVSAKEYSKPDRILHGHQQATGMLSERWDYRGGAGLEGFAFTWKGQTFGMATITARDGGLTGPASYGKFAKAYQAVWQRLRAFTGGDIESLKASSFKDFMEFFDVRAIEPWVLGGYEYTTPEGENRNISFAPMFTITQAGYDRFKENAPALAEKLAAGGFDRGALYYHSRYFDLLSAMFGRGNLASDNEFLGKITVFHELCETEIMERFPETLGSPTRRFFDHTDLSIIDAELVFAALEGKEAFLQRAGIWRAEISTTKLTSGNDWPQDFLEHTDAIYSRLTGILLHPDESWRAYARAAERQFLYPQIDWADVSLKDGAGRDGGAVQEGIEDFILSGLGKNAIVPVDLKEDYTGEQIIDALLKHGGQAVKLDVSAYKPAAGALMETTENYADLLHAIEVLGKQIQIAMHLDFDSTAANNLSFAVEELLKNAFVHGNKCNFDLPVYLILELNGKEFRSLQVIDMAAGENPGLAGDENGQFYAMNAGMTGFNNGIKWLERDHWELIRGDGMQPEGSFALQWKNNVFGSVKISSRDGGKENPAKDPGGIDLRRLSATASSAPFADRRQQIEQFFLENRMPEALQLQECLARRTNNAVNVVEQSVALACVLQIMKTEESLSRPSHPGLIAILTLLSSS